MISRRTGLRLIAISMLLSLLGLYGYDSWLRLLERQDIRQLSWQGLSLSGEGIRLAQLDLQQHSASGVARVEMQGLQLSWRQFGLAPPFWQHIELQRLTLDWQPNAVPAAVGAREPLAIPQMAQALTGLPRSLHIAELRAELPCASGRCELRGELHLHAAPQAALQIDARFELDHHAQRLGWQATLRGDPDALDLLLDLSIDQQPQLVLRSQLQHSPDGALWRGELNTERLSEAAVLQDWLRQWTLASDVQLPGAPGAARLKARWHLQWPAAGASALSLSQLSDASGQFSLDLDLPEPWPIPAVGQVRGSLSVAARARTGHWFAERLQADLDLQALASAWQQQLPEALQTDSLQLRIQPSEPLAELPQSLAERSLPLAIQLSGKGATDFELQTTLALANAPPWAAQLAQGRLQANSAAFALDGWNARQLKLDLRLDGYLDGQGLSLELGQGSSLSLGQLNGPELHLQHLQASTSGLQLEADYPAGALQRLSFAGPHALSVQRLEQPQLKPLGWRWQGKVVGDLQQLKLDGQLRSDAELLLNLQVQRRSTGDLTLQAQLPEVFLRAGNPLSQTLAAWPALLDLNSGRLSASAEFSQKTGDSAPRVRLDATAKGLAAIYDRTLLNGLDTRLRVSLAHNQLRLDLDELQLAEANPGIPLGPLRLRGRYSAHLDQLAMGQLRIDQAQTALMGGSVTLAAGEWNLARRPLSFPLRVNGVKLERLFIAYPTEGLAGKGVLDGKLPLQLDAEGLRIDNGQLAVRAPGGYLRFQSERISALGRSNPAMQLVTQSLENFQYDTLSSRVDYDPSGKLNLNLRLQGRNPAIEQGRPIHFDIKLEEDIPTLLASVQLTDKVNEIITRRVQQRMLERNAATPKEP
jgi:hypothetical protein